MDRSALRKIEMKKALEKSYESGFREIVKIIRKEGDEFEKEINENDIDEERDEVERALEKIDDSLHYKIVKFIIRKNKKWQARLENDEFELVLEINLEKQKFMKENGIKKDIFDYLLKKMQWYLWYSGYV